ncbi:hypothetical protein NQZ68_031838 [Dissostichus eleginoides]|nr:hypothetical protein NQZ68_031838 [Dissostichus eleginoides]
MDLFEATFMKKDTGHSKEVTLLTFVETDLPLIVSNNSQRATKGQRTLRRLEPVDCVCLHALRSRNNLARMN